MLNTESQQSINSHENMYKPNKVKIKQEKIMQSVLS